MKPINVLSLFDGISCGMQALIRASIPVKNYYSSEIDKYANAVSMYNFPNIKRLGDVKKVNVNKLPKIDLLIGGSPCQGFSFAGKKLAFNDPRSKLFFKYKEVLDRLKIINPDIKFLLENVRMKKESLNFISYFLGVEPICINSALLSAQNRVRYYWTNINGITQPSDLNVELKDIIDGDVECVGRIVGIRINTETGKRDDYNIDVKREQLLEKRTDSKSGALTTVEKDNVIVVDREKSNAIISSIGRSTEDQYINRSRGQMVTIPVIQNRGELKICNEKSQCIDANYSKGPDTHGQRTFCIEVGKTDIKCKSPILNGYVWRKLFPIECERLQTIPDNYTLAPHPVYKNRMMSNSQRYKMIGNAWTVDVIAHILKCYENIDTKFKQQSLPGF